MYKILDGYAWKYILYSDWSVLNTVSNKFIAHINSSWYIQVSLNKKKFYLHRLLAIAFIPNPFGYKEINHIDWNKSNNDLSNLEWCNRSMNLKHAFKNWLAFTDISRLKLMNKLAKEKCSIGINQFNTDWTFLKTWSSSMDIERALWIYHNNVTKCCKQKVKTAWWFLWRYSK